MMAVQRCGTCVFFEEDKPGAGFGNCWWRPSDAFMQAISMLHGRDDIENMDCSMGQEEGGHCVQYDRVRRQ